MVGNVDGEMDCIVFECIVVLLEYMLCNVVDYGIEFGEMCCVVGKLEYGMICLNIGCEGGDIFFIFFDDGVGICFDVVWCKVIECGLMSVDSDFSDYEVL